MNSLGGKNTARRGGGVVCKDCALYAGKGQYLTKLHPGDVIMARDRLKQSYINVITEYLALKSAGNDEKTALDTAIFNEISVILK